MNNNICKSSADYSNSSPHQHKKGPSSFWMHDAEKIFNAMELKEGETFLDIGCGIGDYSIYASRIVKKNGHVIALDIQEELITNLKKKADSDDLSNITITVHDITTSLPLKDQSINVCFISTVLHAFNIKKYGEKLFKDISRLLKENGRLVIIECKKEESSFGPPLDMRISPEELEDTLKPFGFKKISLEDLGFNYMMQFTTKEKKGYSQ